MTGAPIFARGLLCARRANKMRRLADKTRRRKSRCRRRFVVGGGSSSAGAAVVVVVVVGLVVAIVYLSAWLDPAKLLLFFQLPCLVNARDLFVGRSSGSGARQLLSANRSRVA